MQFRRELDLVHPIQITNGVFYVPCKVNKLKKSFEPCASPLEFTSFQLRSSGRQIWTEEEDKVLKRLVQESGAKNWSNISTQLNTKLFDGLPIRQGKQCRERWFGSLCPTIVKEPWTSEEDFILFHKQLSHGNKWRLISEFLPGRTENQIKNRWRKIEKIYKFHQKKMKKMLENKNSLDCLLGCLQYDRII